MKKLLSVIALAGILLGSYKMFCNYQSWPKIVKASIVHQEESDGFFNKIGIAKRVKNCVTYASYGTEGQYQERQMNSAERKKYVKK